MTDNFPSRLKKISIHTVSENIHLDGTCWLSLFVELDSYLYPIGQRFPDWSGRDPVHLCKPNYSNVADPTTPPSSPSPFICLNRERGRSCEGGASLEFFSISFLHFIFASLPSLLFSFYTDCGLATATGYPSLLADVS